jgi:formylglycine-generating enzyme required for sulfatase activity
MACRKREATAKLRTRRVLTLIYVLVAGVIAGLIGWINQSYLKERMNWFTTMRPYMLANVRPYVLTAEAEHALKPHASFRECVKQCPEMVVVPAGSFTMGSPATEEGRFDNEGPQHQVVIARPFAVSKFDVTFADWDACISVRGCARVSVINFGRDTTPVINVSWDDAQQYVTWLSAMTGKPYRLLTEAEWEYVARAGTKMAYPWGPEIGRDNANCNGCGSKWDNHQTAPVGSFASNAFGLYDTVGNAWQWVQDCYHEDYNEAPTDGSAWAGGDCSRHVVRGGSWYDGPQTVRSAYRTGDSTVNRNSSLGFRVARTLAP